MTGSPCGYGPLFGGDFLLYTDRMKRVSVTLTLKFEVPNEFSSDMEKDLIIRGNLRGPNGLEPININHCSVDGVHIHTDNTETKKAPRFPETKPKTVEEAVEQLAEFLKGSELEEELKLTPFEDLIKYHHGFGTFIRNEFNLWHEEGLPLLNSTGKIHPDDGSNVIIRALWKYLTGN